VIEVCGRGRIFVYRAPCDMRKHYDTLWGMVVQVMKYDVLAGDVFVFIGKTRKRAKVLWWDGTGLCILCKRMDKGQFFAPWNCPGDGALELSRTELSLLLEGSEWVGKIKLRPETWVPGTP
jgi:transposase